MDTVIEHIVATDQNTIMRIIKSRIEDNDFEYVDCKYAMASKGNDVEYGVLLILRRK